MGSHTLNYQNLNTLYVVHVFYKSCSQVLRSVLFGIDVVDVSLGLGLRCTHCSLRSTATKCFETGDDLFINQT